MQGSRPSPMPLPMGLFASAASTIKIAGTPSTSGVACPAPHGTRSNCKSQQHLLLQRLQGSHPQLRHLLLLALQFAACIPTNMCCIAARCCCSGGRARLLHGWVMYAWRVLHAGASVVMCAAVWLAAVGRCWCCCIAAAGAHERSPCPHQRLSELPSWRNEVHRLRHRQHGWQVGL